MNRYFVNRLPDGPHGGSKRDVVATMIGAGLVALLGVGVQLAIGVALIWFAAWMFQCQ
jgi:hypothetical protein